jgi:uncharacterized protein YbaP (TraB family)
MVTALLAAALAAAAPQPQPFTETAKPAMFMVRDADTTVYIFGTFHALDGKADWFHDQVRSAFDSSNELVLETLVPEGPVQPSAQPAFSIAAPPPMRALPVTTSASFLGTTRLAINAGRSQGMRVDNGADNVLRHAAEAVGKPVEGLETLESQFNMFNHMPTAAGSPPRVGEPVDGSDSNAAMEKLSHTMSAMQAAWKRGDQAVFVNMLDQLRSSSPDTYRVLFTERNARWADWIAARMQTPGTVFVAVGAGHLAGKDSVLVRLAEQGIISTRLN